MARDPYAPRWRLQLADGSWLPTGYVRLVAQVTAAATVDGADELRIRARAWDYDSGSYRIAGDHVLGPGNRVILWGGYGDELVPLQRFSMVREQVDYPVGEVPTVTLRGYSAEVNLVESTRERSWEGPIRDSEIVELIAADHGLTFTGLTIEGTPLRESGRVKKRGTSDLDFLRQLAVANDFGPPVVRYDHRKGSDVLYWRRTDLAFQDQIARFVYDPWQGGVQAGTLRQFRARLSVAGVPTKIEVLGWDAVAQAPMRVLLEITDDGQDSTVYRDEGDLGRPTEEIRSGAELRVAILRDVSDAKGERVEAVHVEHVQTPEDARAWAQRWYRTRQLAFMEGRAIVVGWELLWPGQIHRFDGLAPHHNGLWEWQTVTHTWDGNGYECAGDVTRVLEDRPPVEV